MYVGTAEAMKVLATMVSGDILMRNGPLSPNTSNTTELTDLPSRPLVAIPQTSVHLVIRTFHRREDVGITHFDLNPRRH